MKKLSEIIGMRIIDEMGNAIGEVEKVVYSKSRRKIVAINFYKGRFRKSIVSVPFKDIQNIGNTEIIIREGSIIKDNTNFSSYNLSDEEECELIGYRVITEDGKEIGEVRDIIIDEIYGSIYGYILSEDFFDDLFEGRKLLRFDENIIIGDGALIIQNYDYTIDNIYRNGGLKSFLGLEEK